MSSSLAAVVFVFILGFGWGAAAMVIPMRKEIEKNTQNMITVLGCLINIAKTQDEEIKALRLVSRDCGGIISGTKDVIESVDKLIEEIGNEI